MSEIIKAILNKKTHPAWYLADFAALFVVLMVLLVTWEFFGWDSKSAYIILGIIFGGINVRFGERND